MRAPSPTYFCKLRTDDADEGGVCAVGHGSRAQRLSGSGGSVQQGALRGVDSEVDEAFWRQQRHLDDFSQLLDLLLAASYVAVCDIGLVFDRHHGDRGVNLGRQRQQDLVLVAVDTHPHALLDIRGRDALAEVDDKLGDLLDVDDIFALLGVLLVLYYLGAAGNL